MKRSVKKLFALLLCCLLCAACALPAFAANESNTEGLVFTATLDTPTIAASDKDQAVTMRVTLNKGTVLEGIGAFALWQEPLRIADISNDDPRIDFSDSFNLEKGIIGWIGTDQLDQLEDVTAICTITFTVPGGTPAGTYIMGVQEIELSRNYGNAFESSANALAVLTVTEAPSAAENASSGATESKGPADSTPPVGSQPVGEDSAASGENGSAESESVPAQSASNAASSESEGASSSTASSSAAQAADPVAKGNELVWIAAVVAVAVVLVMAVLVLKNKKKPSDK